ncbi:hypothetical protein V6259_18215 [Marinomonas sp. TI.3.20]|uniref:hypothetical protein n=1 Tax=Marinomonas sp. TI.3.20 TaxID=3121296 RepID=UPI00311F6097
MSNIGSVLNILLKDATSFCQLTISYTQQRSVLSKHICNFFPVMKKVNSASNDIKVLKYLLESKADEEVLLHFVFTSLEDSLQGLLLVHGGKGYCITSTASQSWLSCRRSINMLKKVDGK